MKKSIGFIVILRIWAVLIVASFANNTLSAPKNPAVQTNSDVVVWKFKTQDRICSSPIIHEDVLYIGSFDNIFYAIDAKSGIEKWRIETDNQIRSTAAIHENIICFESGNQLYGSNLQGELQWQFPLYTERVSNQYDSWDYFHSSPRIVDGITYICTEKGLAYGVDVHTGTQVFKCQTTSESGIRVTPAVYNNKIFFGDWNGVMHAYDLTSGEKVWEYDTFPERLWTGGLPSITTSPIIHNDALYFAGRSCILYALNPENGERKWRYRSPTNEWIVGGPRIIDAILYIGSSNQRMSQAFNATSGTRKWRTKLDYRVFGTALIDGDHVFIGTGNELGDKYGSFYALEKNTGEIINRFAVNGLVHSSPIIDNGILYFGCADGYVYALDKEQMLENPLPNTILKDTDAVHFGELPSDTSFSTLQYIHNMGEGADSVSITLNGASKVKKTITIEPIQFELAPNDSQAFSITVEPSGLQQKEYSFSLSIRSKNNLDPTKRMFSKSYKFSVGEPTGVSINHNIFESFSLHEHYPNPFNPTTTIPYSLGQPCKVTLTIFDIQGRIIKRLVDKFQTEGQYKARWDGLDENGQQVGSGLFVYELSSPEFKIQKKMVLIR